MQISKRVFDITFSFLGLLMLSPFLSIFMLFVFLQDWHSPIYIAKRVGIHGCDFFMVKLRSMVVGADKAGIDTASTHDPRITRLGHFIRKLKLDEVLQLWNVLKGDMSIVGPRPNVRTETNLYTQEELRLLSIRPGITDLSSIVFSDLGEIVVNAKDTNISYNQLVRPWKSRLGLIYIDHLSLGLDLRLIFLTFISIFSRKTALRGVSRILESLSVPADIVQVSRREQELLPTPPPGSDRIVTTR